MNIDRVSVVLVVIGCSAQEQDTALDNDFPIESVSCTHPDSDYEAVVEVVVEDDYGWEEIHFQIRQDEETWDTLLWEPGEEDLNWRTRMQIMEFNCRTEYDYDFLYVAAINESW